VVACASAVLIVESCTRQEVQNQQWRSCLETHNVTAGFASSRTPVWQTVLLLLLLLLLELAAALCLITSVNTVADPCAGDSIFAGSIAAVPPLVSPPTSNSAAVQEPVRTQLLVGLCRCPSPA
jgi:hypothetical protein